MAYGTDPVAEPPAPATAFSDNGVVELLPLNSQFLIAMERSCSSSARVTPRSRSAYLGGAVGGLIAC